jgi:hypothetical protein
MFILQFGEINVLVGRVDQMEDSQITRCRPTKTIRETIMKDLAINELDRDIIYVRTLWRSLIHVADPTYWDNAWLLLLSIVLFSWDVID